MTWPAVFDGIGALVVNCALEPDELVAKIPGLTWIAFKVGGVDVAPDAETQHCYDHWRARGLTVGAWVYCTGPPARDVTTLETAVRFGPIAFGIFDIEEPYKTDAGAPSSWPLELATLYKGTSSAITSYGAIPGYGNQPSSIDFAPFAAAGWPIIAQSYDGYSVPDADTYATTSGQKFPGPYLASGVHTMVRSLTLVKSQAVYRPESIDG